MHERNFGACTVGLALQNALAHVRPMLQYWPQGVLNPTVMWRRDELVQERVGLIPGLHGDKSTVTTISTVHQELIRLEQLLLPGRIIYETDFVGNQGRTPAHPERPSPLPIPIEPPLVVPTVNVEQTKDALVFRAKTTEYEWHIFHTWNAICCISALAGGMQVGCSFQGERRL